MTQHSDNPYYGEDNSDLPMWKQIDGKLIHTVISARKSFGTNISKSILESLEIIAVKNNIRINYLLVYGLENLLSNEVIYITKIRDLKIAHIYKTTYDDELLANVKELKERSFH